MDLARLVSLLTSRKLNLTRVDRLNDEYEGSVTRGVFEKWSASVNAATFALMRPRLKKTMYVSCWHMNMAESEAMWRLYCRDKEGIALCTTYERLDVSLPADVFFGKVTYVDYESDGDMSGDINALTPFMHKRQAFEHEREVRVLVWPPALLYSGEVSSDPVEPAHSIQIDWDIVQAIESVFVSPYAPEWYRDVIAAVLDRFCPPLSQRLVWSEMKGVPRY